MDIRLLKTFCVVAQLENITRAAELLNFTQPTVSAQIRTLEEHFRISLFERIGKRLFITDAGKCLVEPAERILAIYDDTVTKINSLSEVQCTRIGISTSYVNTMLSPALSEVQKKQTAGNFSVDICQNSNAVLKGVISNKYDIGIVHDYISEKYLNTVKISTEDLVWVGHNKNNQG